MEGHLSSSRFCWRPAACFFLFSSFLLLAFYAAQSDKFGSILAQHFTKVVGNSSGNSSAAATPTRHDFDVWPSERFWQTLTQDQGRKMHNTCTFSGCPSTHPTLPPDQSPFSHPFDPQRECPVYSRYIHEDLSPWTHPNSSAPDDDQTSVRVSRAMLDTAASLADFRIVIKKGRLYVDALTPCFQTRSIFTIWGLLQLLRYYPGLVPDVDLLFGCGDTPRVFRRDFQNPSVSPPPPVFRYCSTPLDFDIPFPDWSFWGWPEVNLRCWDGELYDVLKGENELLWEERDPTAFWKGNTDTGSALRKELQRCNGRQNGATVIHQNWWEETNAQFKNSKLASQCKHRYKIYAEGWGWSVSLKYIMACDSPALIIEPVFHDFFSRGLVPMKNFWPVNREKLCNSIKFATEWGNKNTIAAEAIGRAGRQYMTRDLSMKNVYDYMLHLLYQYSKLLDFEPEPGPNMQEVCVDAFLCQAPAQEKVLYRESMVKEPSADPPCSLHPRDKAFIQERLNHRAEITRLIREAEESADGGASLTSHLLNSNGRIT